MRGINPQRILDFIRKDVELVEEEASIVMTISPDERTFEIKENQNPRLNVIAVLGSADGFGKHWDKVILIEIGISRTRPYNEVKGLKRISGQSNLHSRRKWFCLSPSQYQLVAPTIFRTMNVMTLRKVLSWKSGGPSNRYLIPSERHWWLRSQKKLIKNPSMTEALTGARFHISLKDELFVRDVYWAELNLNQRLGKIIRGLARFISLRLNWYQCGRYKGRKKFEDLLGVKQAEERLDATYLKKFPHLLCEVAQQIKNDRRNLGFWQFIAERVGWNGRDTKERELASLAPQLLGLRERLGGIQILVTTSLDKKKEFVTFEVQK